MRVLVSSIALVFSLAACGGDDPRVPVGADASTPRPDATMVRLDATVTPDSGTIVDGGTPADTGAVVEDSGLPVVDSGVVEDGGAPVDSGVAVEDSGLPVADAGVIEDGGTPVDAGAVIQDGGLPVADTGVVVIEDSGIVEDGGVVVVPDAGVIVPDSGVVVADAGVVVPADSGVVVVPDSGVGDAGSAPDAATNPSSYVESVLAAPVWVDACATGTTLTLTDDDDGHGPATTIPFAFSFFGAPRTAVWASTNGFLTFDVQPQDGYQPVIPDVAEGPAIYAFWQDLALFDATAAVCIATTGTAPNRRMVIQWNDMQSLEAFDLTSFTFQAQLHEGTHIIDFIYATMSVDDPGDAPLANGTLLTVVGLQTAAGAQTVVHSGAISTTTGIRFTP